MITPTSNRSRLAGLSMTVGGVLLAVAALLGPPNGADDTAARLADLAAHPGLTVAKSLVLQAAVLLLLPGVVAIIGRTRGRGAAVVLSGGVVYAAGIVGAFTFMVLSGLEVAVAGAGPVDPTLVAVDDRMSSSPAAVPALVLALLLFHLVGLPWLAFGMVRARQIPLWLAAVATIGTCCAFFGSGTRVETVGWIALGLTLTGIAFTLWAVPASSATQSQPHPDHRQRVGPAAETVAASQGARTDPPARIRTIRESDAADLSRQPQS
jgi:hypothetical protein